MGDDSNQFDRDPLDPDEQLLKLGILAFVMAGFVLCVAISRPFIFGRVLPALLGTVGTVESGDVGVDESPTDEPPPTTTPTPATLTATPSITPTATLTPTLTATPSAVGTPPVVVTLAPTSGVYLAPIQPGAQTHVVQPGETLAIIAAQYNVSIAALVQANAINDPNYIQAGMTLVIPGSGYLAPATPAP